MQKLKSPQEALISEALAIEAESAQNAGALGFMARAMVQATLPHRKVEGTEFKRHNGAFTLSLLAPSDVGLPYGTMPRLLLAWLTTEAVRTKSRHLELGESLSAFMRELGLLPTGGRWGSITRLKDQTARLFSCTVSAIYKEAHRRSEMGYRLTDGSVLWWDAPVPNHVPLWRSTVTLTERFYAEVVNFPVPVDMRVIKLLKQSPLALDLYSWLTYRVSYLEQPSTVPWEALALQLGSDYGRLRAFKEALLVELRRVATVYPAVRFEATAAGLILKPSPTHVSLRTLS